MLKNDYPMLSNSNEIPVRDVLTKIDNLFFKQQKNIVVLYNTQANGKSNLAINYVNSIFLKEHDNNRAVRWINSSNTHFIRLYFRTVLTASLDVEYVSYDFKNICLKIRDKLSADNNYLFIFDNLKNFEEARVMIEIWPNFVKTLITTTLITED
jgi:hypothetical protein